MVMNKLQVKANSVEEGVPIKDEFSLCREDHEPQVVPDRYPVSVRNISNTRFACWNVKTIEIEGTLFL